VLVGTPGPYSSSSLRTTILCPRLPSAPPPPAGRCPAASSQPQGRRPSAGRSAVSPDPVGLNYCSSSIFPPFPKCCWPTHSQGMSLLFQVVDDFLLISLAVSCRFQKGGEGWGIPAASTVYATNAAIWGTFHLLMPSATSCRCYWPLIS